MYKSNIQRFQKEYDSFLNFSFSQAKDKVKTDISDSIMTKTQKQSLGMWVKTVLESHSQQFLYALKHCRILSIVQLNQYIQQHYQHLKMIIRYYIIAALMDYQHVQNKQHGQSSTQCIFLNTVIEQLAYRFFRQSQWLHKISHIPNYFIYTFFDSYLKGFTTISQIKFKTFRDLSVSFGISSNNKQLTQKKEKELEMLVQMKFRNNISGYERVISQQNFEEVMLRVNLNNFQDVFMLSRETRGSWRYEVIYKGIKEYENLSTQRQIRENYKEIDRIRKDKEELEMMKEEYSIRYKSELMSQKSATNQLYSHTKSKNWKSTGFDDIHLSTPQPSSYAKKCYPQSVNNQVHKSPISERALKVQSDFQNRNHQTDPFPDKIIEKRQIHLPNTIEFQDKIITDNIIQIQRNKEFLVQQEMILKQLEVLKEDKRRNYAKMLRYI